MISDARRGHVSPGIYTEEKDVVFSVKSLGITSLGLVGETLYGPAFQNVEISSWGEFVDYFGGTSTEKFKNGNPKYELPYVAKSYLEESKHLNVVRVLGLSGYDAGPAFIICESGSTQPIVVLRSKMTYNGSGDICGGNGEKAQNIVTNVTASEYSNTSISGGCSNSGVSVDTNNKFSIIVSCKSGYGFSTSLTYNVSLNPNDSDYIYNIIDSTPEKGTTPIYIEAVYENSLPDKGVSSNSFSATTKSGDSIAIKKYYEITEIVSAYTSGVSGNNGVYKVEEADYSAGAIYIGNQDTLSAGTFSASSACVTGQYVYTSGTSETGDKFSNFKEGYRPAVTPWIVSEAISDSSTTYLKTLFRFITISDGDAANFQVKVSIQNINMEEGTFDVIVRDFYDSDANPLILESFRKCNLIFGDANCVAAKIGTSDGGFVSKSKYILVEMAEGEDFGKSFPAGFLGYPMPSYISASSAFNISYNTTYKPEIKAKRQYFGLSDLAGIDSDIFKYKGVYFYDWGTDNLTKGFHMDAAINSTSIIYVDGVPGYAFDGVSNDTKGYGNAPRLNAYQYQDSIYEDIKTRKFTVCFCGGFDGWDINRGERTNTDAYKSTKYGRNNSNFYQPYKGNDLSMNLDLPLTAITSDYYAYLAGCRVFSNPQDIDINIFATPGINWGDNTMLTEEVIDMIEDADDGRGGDALYVMASPGPNEVTTPQEIVDAFEDAGINSSYACTYFPWVMYYDASNKRYLNLPVTKDVVKNMAAVDNNSYPWFAPAGTERGKVNCVKAAYKTRLSDEDALYEANINPVKSFAQDGVIIWGNKTAYPVETPNNRINVRRMMIRLKKLIVNAAKNLIFEQYDEELEKQFRGIVEPILADVKANRGIIDYRVITECTPETRDQHILPAKILVKPVQSLEYISISFVVYPESVKFDE